MYNNAPPNIGPNVANVASVPHMPYCYTAPVYGGYGCNNFAIIVVLFILLIIIGACAFNGYKC